MVLNNPPRPAGDSLGGPCYRCVFPKPPPPESVVSCGEGGILGPVVGVMGVLQALEAIKLIVAGLSSSHSSNSASGDGSSSGSAPQTNPEDKPSLLLFSAYSNPQFRSIRLRSRKSKCAACSAHATIPSEALTSGSMDYVQFCGAINPINVLGPSERVSVTEFAAMKAEGARTPGLKPGPLLVDVREKVQFDLGNIYHSINIPYSEIAATRIENDGVYDAVRYPWIYGLGNIPPCHSIYVVCRLGNDSQLAARKFKELGIGRNGERWIGDIAGGLSAWRQQVDPDFPDY